MLDSSMESQDPGVAPHVSTPPVSFEVIRALPKTDLHVHLDGSLRLSTILELAKKERIALPGDTIESLREAIGCGRHFGSLVEYLRGFGITLKVMQTEEALERIAFELAEDAHQENVRYMEVRYAPMLHTQRGLKLTRVVEAVLEGLRRARETFGIKATVIVCGIRNISPESSYEMAELAVAYKGRGVVGFDLAGAEADFPAKHHRAAFQLVRDNNINCTIHAGEAYGPESIAQAIHVCGAHRIGHACRLRENGDLLHYLNDHRIPLECCPSSNVQTGAVRDFKTHPLKLYFDLGLRVTINTDNRLITDTSVSKELYRVHTELGVPFSDIKSMIVAGFKSSFQPFHEKQALLRKVVAELLRYDDCGVLRDPNPTNADRPVRLRGSAEIPASAE
ncbi:MAG TPA: adenosine deaminase [Polyangiaceae bacterium]|nr:adenosine deaminase [Polyangiaceae bacterium]